MNEYKFNDFTRLEAALNHQEPDRIPLVEVVVSYEAQSYFLGKNVGPGDIKKQVEFWSKAGYDYIPLTIGLMKPGGVTEESLITEAVEEDISEESFIKSGILKNNSDLDKKINWNKAKNIDDHEFQEANKYLPEKMKIIATTGKIFTLAWMLMGFESFCLGLSTKPDLIQELINRISEIQIKAIKKVAKNENVKAIWIVDDLAFDTGLIISPNHLEKYVYPAYRKLIEVAKDNGLYTILHSDGDIRKVIDDLVEIGIDAIHPIDPNALDIKEIKDRHGDEISLFGNVDVELLANGTQKEIEEYVKYLIKNIAPGGGYGLGSGNSVPNWANFDNYKKMVETCLKYGEYPIEANK